MKKQRTTEMINLQKEEAIKRLKMLGLHPNVLKDFKKGVLNESERARVLGVDMGVLYWLEDDEKALVEELQEKYNAVVYHVILTRTEFGRLLDFLYVSSYEEEWEDDLYLIKQGMTYVFSNNLDCPDCSEIGSIGFKEAGGGLLRTW